MIQKNMCEQCSKSTVCSVKRKLDPFADDAKKDLGITIAMVSCEEFSAKDED